ncbi:hypothetical protein AURDEDRAFT_141402 [Auricularia subglabra TFB-10046 SS5]|nr:hypothetical protein AURDEDRAFT_141402 [Auricularia subglabra TFB-10046 SS5]
MATAWTEPLATCDAPAGVLHPGMGKVAIVSACLAAAIAACDADEAIVDQVPNAQREHAASTLRTASTNTEAIGLVKVACVRPQEFAAQLNVDPTPFQAEMNLTVAAAHLVTVGDAAHVLFSVLPGRGSNATAVPPTFLVYQSRPQSQEGENETLGRLVYFKSARAAAKYLTALCSEVATTSSALVPRCVIHHFALDTHVVPAMQVFTPGTFLTLPTNDMRGEPRILATLLPPASPFDPAAWGAWQGVDPLAPVTISLSPNPTPAPAPSGATFTCTICLDTFGPLTSAVHMDGCNHDYCPGCLAQYVRFKLEEHEYPILCPLCIVTPDAGQRGMITDGVLAEIQIEESTWRRWNDVEFEKFSTKITCRGCSRSSYVDTMDYHAAEVIACPLPDCCFRWCKECNKPVDEHGAEVMHVFTKPPPTSRIGKMAFRLKNKVKAAGRKLRATRLRKDAVGPVAPPPHECEDGADLLFDVVREMGWRYCPGCNTPTERVTGCNHMMCALCMSNWCYHCGLMSGAYGLRRELRENERLCYGLHEFD